MPVALVLTVSLVRPLARLLTVAGSLVVGGRLVVAGGLVVALGLIVTDMNDQRITFGRASGRFFARIISNLIPLEIGYIMAGFTEKKQALHDMIASCLVLRKI